MESSYIKRDNTRWLAQIGGSGFLWFFIGILFLWFAIGFLKGNLESSLGTLYYIQTASYGLFFLIFTYHIFRVVFLKDVSPKSPKFYSPQKIFQRRKRQFIGGIIFLTLFIVPILIDRSASWILKTAFGLGSIVLILWRGFVFRKFRLEYLFGREIGDSYININNEPIQKGDRAKILFKNERLHTKTNEIQIYLRNIKEIWVPSNEYGQDKENKGSERVVGLLLYEHQELLAIETPVVEFSLSIPLDEGCITDYNKVSPCYWELEISSDTCNYYSRFFIDVN